MFLYVFHRAQIEDSFPAFCAGSLKSAAHKHICKEAFLNIYKKHQQNKDKGLLLVFV